MAWFGSHPRCLGTLVGWPRPQMVTEMPRENQHFDGPSLAHLHRRWHSQPHSHRDDDGPRRDCSRGHSSQHSAAHIPLHRSPPPRFPYKHRRKAGSPGEQEDRGSILQLPGIGGNEADVWAVVGSVDLDTLVTVCLERSYTSRLRIDHVSN